jgi:hypothetical protein
MPGCELYYPRLVMPEGGRGLHYPYSNEIVMMHAWIPLEAFKALIERMIGVDFNSN